MTYTEKIAIIFILFLSLNLYSQNTTNNYYCIGFYNLENLFDTIHDEGKNDYEFLPKGVYEWNSKKYTNKIKNISSVLANIGTEIQSNGASLVGICEVENSNVLNDLVKTPAITNKKWRYIHIEGEDSRGIDCALLYNPAHFKPQKATLIPFDNIQKKSNHKTRGFLIVSGILANESLHIIINHWPSRYSKSVKREYAANKVKAIKDSIILSQPNSKIIIMGDFNDNPDNKSLKECLEAKQYISEIKRNSDLYNPWWNILRKEKQGTIKYKEHWQLYDQIIISGNLCNKKSKGLKYVSSKIYCRTEMINQNGKYKNYPKRTHINGIWQNGYSDHLPVMIYLHK